MGFAIIDSSRGTNAIDILLLCQCPLLLLQHQYTKCKIQLLLFLIQVPPLKLGFVTITILPS